MTHYQGWQRSYVGQLKYLYNPKNVGGGCLSSYSLPAPACTLLSSSIDLLPRLGTQPNSYHLLATAGAVGLVLGHPFDTVKVSVAKAPEE